MNNITEITDFNAPELDIYARLSEVQLLRFYEPKPGLFIAESPNVILRALNAGYEPISLLVERKHIDGQAAELISRCPDVPVYTADFDVLTRLTGFQLTRGLLCAMKRAPLPSVADVCAGARRIAVLENVMNPTNVGAIFRSAAALNMDAVLLTDGCSDPLYRRASRVSMGTVFQVPWTFIRAESDAEHNACTAGQLTGNHNQNNKTEADGQPRSYIGMLHELGFKTAAMALTDESVSIDDPRVLAEEKLAIVLGTEGEGLPESTIAECDYTVKIPMSHGVDSLNVAAASAVAFWVMGR